MDLIIGYFATKQVSVFVSGPTAILTAHISIAGFFEPNPALFEAKFMLILCENTHDFGINHLLRIFSRYLRHLLLT